MKPTVLFVDDHPEILQGISRVLRNQPYDILLAHSAEDAISMLKRTTIDVIVSDEAMKGMRGTEFLCWAAEHFPDTVRIMLTGQPSVPSMQTAINNAGVFRYLVKPVRDYELTMTIQDALELNSRQASTV